ncbi:MAG TPA: SUMF1/EgtB/PvdO family nonheme iron enzyme [Bacteroidia bacterium]|nr:SUMF1/EgtB/PvdO family nonheme iron enzyme [Bacteroidia bacterium]
MKFFRFVTIIPFFLLLLSAGQDPVLPKLKSFTVQLPGTSSAIDRGEISLGDWLAFVYKTTYNWDNEAFETGRKDSLMPDTNILPEKYRLIIRLFNRLDFDNAPASTKWHLFYGNNTYAETFQLPVTKAEWDNDTLKKHIEKYVELPVVGISYWQAQQYCAWRATEMMKEKNVIDGGWKVKGRLLTLDEWTKFQYEIGPRYDSNKTDQIDTINKTGCYLLNIKTDKPCESLLEGWKIYGGGTVAVFSFNPDNLGLYQMFGNVSEMLQEEGKAVGGSYLNYGNECRTANIISYSAPQPWLGFRCVFDFSR